MMNHKLFRCKSGMGNTSLTSIGLQASGSKSIEPGSCMFLLCWSVMCRVSSLTMVTARFFFSLESWWINFPVNHPHRWPYVLVGCELLVNLPMCIHKVLQFPNCPSTLNVGIPWFWPMLGEGWAWSTPQKSGRKTVSIIVCQAALTCPSYLLMAMAWIMNGFIRITMMKKND